LLAGTGCNFGFFAYRQPGYANVERQSQTQEVIPDSIQDFRQQNAVSITSLETGVISNTVILDNETIAAVIAVENAALTSPQYLSELPIISR